MITYPFQVGPTLTRILEAGDAGAPPILLLHGFTSRADRWRSNIDALASKGYRVIAPDLPGHGFATKDAKFDHSVPGYVVFVRTLLDELGIACSTLVGTSLGGHVLASVACAEPERTAQLVMIGSMGLEDLPPGRVAAMLTGLEDMSPAAMRRRLESVFSDPGIVTDELVREDILVNTSPGAQDSLRAFMCYLASGFASDLVGERLVAADGRFPVLLLWGGRDGPSPVAIAQSARATLPSARLAVMEGLSHTPYMEDAESFRRILLAFIAGRLDKVRVPGLVIS